MPPTREQLTRILNPIYKRQLLSLASIRYDSYNTRAYIKMPQANQLAARAILEKLFEICQTGELYLEFNNENITQNRDEIALTCCPGEYFRTEEFAIERE
jgi:hypothetical protein